MCGRARCTIRADDIPRACGINNGGVRSVQMDRYRQSYNVSPGAYMPVVRRDGSGGEGAVLHCMKWGLIPSFTKKTEKPDHFRMFNARSESVSEKASFRRLVPNNRCLVAVEGFYEWKKDGSKKQPYYIHFKDERPLIFAALYDSWKNSEGEVLYTFTILTTCSSSALQWLHDRMPVVLGHEGSVDAWLNGSSKLDSVLKPYEDPDMVWYPVTPAMGKTSLNGPECIKEIQLKSEEKNSISKFFTKKRIENQQESATIDPLSVKDEPGNQEDTEDTSDSKGNISPEPDVSSLLHEDAGKCGIKREYEESAADLKPMIDSSCHRLETSPPKKKANLKSAGDKQPTLLSYFSKS